MSQQPQTGSFLQFPAPMVEELRRVEQVKINIITGFLYAVGLKDKRLTIAPDLSGVQVDEQPGETPTQTETK